jgi:hypothetical protein
MGRDGDVGGLRDLLRLQVSALPHSRLVPEAGLAVHFYFNSAHTRAATLFLSPTYLGTRYL